MILKFPESLSAYYEAVFEPIDLKSQMANLTAKKSGSNIALILK